MIFYTHSLELFVAFFISTLGYCPLFQSPSLPTVDVHFISQIKAFTRESMIVSLVKTASELEVFARETEMATGNVEQLLRPTFEMYKLTPPQLPNPIPLTAYPLDFRAPEGMFFTLLLSSSWNNLFL